MIIVSAAWYATDPQVYWFTLSVDDGVTNELVPLSVDSVVVAEIQTGNNWHVAQLQVAVTPDGYEAIRTIVPPALQNGIERNVRLTVDGVLYGPWVFRFHAP